MLYKQNLSFLSHHMSFHLSINDHNIVFGNVLDKGREVLMPVLTLALAGVL